MKPTSLLSNESIIGGRGSLSGDTGSSINVLGCACAACEAHAATFVKTPITMASAIGVPSTIAAPPQPSEGSVTIGTPFYGSISPVDDVDYVAVSLVAGQTYSFSLRGTGSTPVNDTFLQLLDANGRVINSDDDGGAGIYSLLTYTAATTGTYYVEASSFSAPGQAAATGDYRIDVNQRGTDTVGSTNATSVALNPGLVFGFIETSGDVDRYSVTLEAGKLYTFEMAGGADYNTSYLNVPAGELDTILALRDAAGSVIAVGDDIDFPGDISSTLSFVATTSGTFYLDAMAYEPNTGGYTLDMQITPLTDLDPLDSINWFSANNVQFRDVNGVPTAFVYFGDSDENFGQTADDGVSPMETIDWNAYEKTQVLEALEQFEKILGVDYVMTEDVDQATFRLLKTESDDYGAYFFPQDPAAYGSEQGIGVFNVLSGAWTFDQQQSLEQGGYSFSVVLHEFGHAHGLAHPHDRGGGSDVMLGVTGPTGSYGIYNLNQSVYTVMSYNDGWDFHPDGPSPFTVAGIDNGWAGTLSAFDIAVLQQRYGVHAYATGNDTYVLDDVQRRGTFYETIWDTGGVDTISYTGARAAQIDLTAATLDYSPTGAGVISFVDDIKGGFTIANGVVIENATGGSGNDVLIGNSAANVLTGNAGDDFLMGKGGGDTLNGGAGTDTVSYAMATAGVTASLTSNTGGGGDRYISIEAFEGSAFGDSFTGGNANDRISGLGGDDVLTGGNGNDTLNGGAGADTLDGGNGDDALDGGAGNDTLRGGNGNDVLNGGEGDDILTGGNNNDIFAFFNASGNDTITDFRRGQDRIDLSGMDANTSVSGVNSFAFIGAGAFSGSAGELRAYSQGGSNFLAGDVNGDRVADFTIGTGSTLIVSNDIMFTAVL